MKVRNVGTMGYGQVVQRLSDLKLAVVLHILHSRPAKMVVRPLGGSQNEDWDWETQVHAIDIEGMATEMERLSARGTQTRHYLCALAWCQDTEEVYISADELAAAAKTEITKHEIGDDGSLTLGFKHE